MMKGSIAFLRHLTSVTAIVLFLVVPTSAQEEDFSFSKINEHIRRLRNIREHKSESTSGFSYAEALNLEKELRYLDNYAQSLVHYYLEAFNNGTLQPYSLNLIHEFFKTQLTVHQKVLSLPKSEPALVLQAYQLISFKKVHDLFFHRKSLRGLLGDQISSPGNDLEGWEALKRKTLDKNRVKRLQREIDGKLFPLNMARIGSSTLGKNTQQQFYTNWYESYAYKMLETDQDLKELTNTDLFWRNIGDGVLAGLGKVTTGASAAFGAVAGNIAWREGHLKNNEALLSKLEETLQPFDLLMEKKAYKFTDITIPGHWGHVGVYMGSQEQLEQMGLWDLPEMAPFRENIKKGKRIFQVRRWGLVFDSLRDFVNLDEMAVLRVEGMIHKSSEELAMTVEYLGDQLNKSYDFSFDAMTGETITCTEIIAFSYGSIKWPMDRILGRLTISPNNLAELAFYTGSPLKTLLYITGSSKGMQYHSEADFGETLNYVPSGGVYKKHSLKCQREMYRHRRDSLRFRYSCDDIYTENKY